MERELLCGCQKVEEDKVRFGGPLAENVMRNKHQVNNECMH